MTDLDNKSFELKVGIFIAVGILVFFIIVFSIGDVSLIRKGYHVNVIFDFAEGLTESAPVRVAGVHVGQIDKIGLFFDENEKRTKVKLLAWINDENVRIEKDAKVVINTLGLLGEKYLEIFPGKDIENILKNDDEIMGYDSVPTEFMKEKFNDLLNSATVVMERFEKGEGTIGKLMKEEKIYDDLEAFVADIKKHPWKLLHKTKSDR